LIFPPQGAKNIYLAHGNFFFQESKLLKFFLWWLPKPKTGKEKKRRAFRGAFDFQWQLKENQNNSTDREERYKNS